MRWNKPFLQTYQALPNRFCVHQLVLIAHPIIGDLFSMLFRSLINSPRLLRRMVTGSSQDSPNSVRCLLRNTANVFVLILFWLFDFFLLHWQLTNNLKQILLTILANIFCLKCKWLYYQHKYLVIYLYKSLTLQDCKWILGHLTAKFGIINIQR